jgi:hypothetical protein
MRKFFILIIALGLLVLLGYVVSKNDKIDSGSIKKVEEKPFVVPRRISLFAKGNGGLNTPIPITCTADRELAPGVRNSGTLNASEGYISYKQLIETASTSIYSHTVIDGETLYTYSTTTDDVYTYTTDLSGDALESSWYDKKGNIYNDLPEHHMARVLVGELGQLTVTDRREFTCTQLFDSNEIEEQRAEVQNFVDTFPSLVSTTTTSIAAKTLRCNVCTKIENPLPYGKCLAYYGCEVE